MLGIPTALLHECPGSVITVELKTHEVYRGYLDDVEDNWNMHVTNITRTERDGESLTFFCLSSVCVWLIARSQVVSRISSTPTFAAPRSASSSCPTCSSTRRSSSRATPTRASPPRSTLVGAN